MRCTKCLAASQAHTVVEEDRSGGGIGRPQRSWDASDREHRHDPRWDVVYLRCSNGHTFKAVERLGRLCPHVGNPCDFDAKLSESIAKEWVRRFHGALMLTLST